MMERPVTKQDYLYIVSKTHELKQDIEDKARVSKSTVLFYERVITTYRSTLIDLISKSDDALVIINELANLEIFKLSKDTLIEDCNLSIRAHNAIRRLSCDVGDVYRICDLESVSITHLKSMHAVGKKTFKEIVDLCDSVGVKMKP